MTFIEKLIFSASVVYCFYLGILQWSDNVKDFAKWRPLLSWCMRVCVFVTECVCNCNFMGSSCTTNFVCCVVLCGFGFVTLSHERRLRAACWALQPQCMVAVVPAIVVAAVISIHLLTAILRI